MQSGVFDEHQSAGRGDKWWLEGSHGSRLFSLTWEMKSAEATKRSPLTLSKT